MIINGGSPTRRQLDVLRLLSAGLTGKQIAHELGITEATVKIHASKMRKNIHAKTTAHAVALYVRKCCCLQQKKC